MSIAYITIVQGNKFYYATAQSAYTVDTTTMSFIGDPIPMPNYPYPQFSFAPYLGTHMVTSNEGVSSTTISDNIMTYIKVSDRTVDSTKFNFVGGNPSRILIYKNTTNEMPIIVSYTGSYPDYITIVKSPQYEHSFTGELPALAWIEGDYLQIFTKGAVNANSLKYYVFHAVSIIT